MFTLPPLPPKDYVLKDVNQNQKSSPEFTPVALPRITQSNLGKFSAPIEYQDNEKLENLQIDYSLNPQILDRLTKSARAFWVDQPGKNDYFLHDIFKKYTVEVMPSYDSRFKSNERVFYRSFQYELECLENERLKKLHRKMEREESEEVEKYKIMEEKNTRFVEKLGVEPCKNFTPFWWKDEMGKSADPGDAPLKAKPYEITYSKTSLRWQDEPSLTEYAKPDPCKRRREMALVGMPYKNEACNWYYNNYPPPNIRFIRKKFA